MDGRRSSVQVLTVYIVDANDLDPSFDLEQYIVSLPETNDTGINLVTLRAAERVGGRVISTPLEYVITSGNTSVFYLVADRDGSGFDITHVYSNTSLDFETEPRYTLEIMAVNQRATGEGFQRNGTTIVSINLQDVNDNYPIFEHAIINTSVREDASRNTIVGTFVASDADSGRNGQISYAVVGPHSETFGVQSETAGQIIVIGPLDYERVTSYSLTIRATDNSSTAPLSQDATLNVAIIDVNDNPPVFSPPGSTYTCQQMELSPPGDTCVTLNVSDADAPGTPFSNVTLTLQGGNGFFALDGSSLVTTAVLARDVAENYTLFVIARDGGGLIANAIIQVTVVDSNNHIPVFTEPVYTTSVREVIGRINITTVTAVDGDQPGTDNVRIEYTLMRDDTGGNGLDMFVIDGATGEISIRPREVLDREVQSLYVLTVQAQDFGIPTRFASNCTVRITVLDYNDNAPRLNRLSFACTLPENAPIGTPCARVTGVDVDAGFSGSILFGAGTTVPSVFAVNATTGLVTTAGLLDRETEDAYSFTISARDDGARDGFDSLSSAANASVVVTVQDVNDEPPVIVGGTAFNVSVREDAVVGSTAFVVNTTDGDIGANGVDGHRYFLTGGAGVFTIGITTGVVTIQRALDAAVSDAYTITITVIDRGGLRDVAVVSAVVVDINNCNPVFDESVYFSTVSEDAEQGTVVSVVSVTDCDTGLNAEARFSITSGNTGNLFAIGPTNTTHANIVVQRALLDFELRQQTYRLNLIALDRGVPQRSGTVALILQVTDVNDNAPVFTAASNPTSFAVPPALIAGAPFGNVHATDVDSGDNGRVVYSLEAHDSAFDGVFEVGNTSGLLSATVPASALSTTPVGLRITAQDLGNPSFATDYNITVYRITSDDNPVFTQTFYDAVIPENSGRGTSVTSVAAISMYASTGSGSTVTYEVVRGDAFTVNSVSGEVLVQTASLDRETQNVYTVLVAANATNITHPTPQRSYAIVRVTLTDVNDMTPTFTTVVYRASIDECLTGALASYNPSGCMMNGGVLSVLPSAIATTDGDEAGTRNTEIVYSMTGDSNFTIVASTGQVAITSTSDSDPNLDFEGGSVRSLIITATDNGLSPLSSSVELVVTVVDLNDHSPQFTPAMLASNGSVSENALNGTIVMQLEATDADSAAHTTFAYEIRSGAGTPPRFTVDRATGVITKASSLDHETQSEYVLGVRVSDGGLLPGALHADAVVRVFVEDDNDFAPEWITPTLVRISIPENISWTDSNVTIFTLRGQDRDDVDVSGTLSYVLDLTDADLQQGFFTVDERTGDVSTTGQNFSFATQPVHTFAVQLYDSGFPTLRASEPTLFVISILDINDGIPTFAQTEYFASVSEEADGGSAVVRMQAFDTDAVGSPNAEVTYALSGDSRFVIDAQTGQVRVATPGAGESTGLDYENVTDRVIRVTITAADGGTPSLQSSVVLTISLTDANDNRPVLNSIANPAVVLAEDASVGTFVAQITGTDADSTVAGGVVFYRIIDESDRGRFRIAPESGVIVTAGTFDYEAPGGRAYQLRIQGITHTTCIVG